MDRVEQKASRQTRQRRCRESASHGRDAIRVFQSTSWASRLTVRVLFAKGPYPIAFLARLASAVVLDQRCSLAASAPLIGRPSPPTPC